MWSNKKHWGCQTLLRLLDALYERFCSGAGWRARATTGRNTADEHTIGCSRNDMRVDTKVDEG